jgi:hypothetical protein
MRVVCYYHPDSKFTSPKQIFWKAEQTLQSALSKHFSRTWVLDLGYEPLKSQSKIRISSFVHPSKIFVWGAWKCFANALWKVLFALPKYSFRRCKVLIWKYTSSCYHHLVSWTYASSCYHHDDSKLWFGHTHRHAIIISRLDVYSPQTKIWRSDKHFRVRFPGKHFSRVSILATQRWKVLPRETHSEMFVRPSNLRLGGVKLSLKDISSCYHHLVSWT